MSDIDDVRTVLAAGELAVAEKDWAALQAWPDRWAAAAGREVVGWEQMGRARSLFATIALLGLGQRGVRR